MSTSNLPRWMQHNDELLPDPTPEEVAEDYQQSLAEVEYFEKHGKWSPESDRMLEDLAEHYGNMPLEDPPKNALEAFTAWLARLDWHKVFYWTARLIVAGFIVYAGYKLVQVWQAFPGWQFLAFLDMHAPLMIFSGVFVFFFLHHRDSEIMGVIALFSTVLNALLV